MAALNDLLCHINGCTGGSGEPSVGGKRGASATATAVSLAAAAAAVLVNDPAHVDAVNAVACPMNKKAKIHKSCTPESFLKTAGAAKHEKRGGHLIRLPSPKDIRDVDVDPSRIMGTEWGSQPRAQASVSTMQCSRVKILSPTVRGIIDAARVLRASKTSYSAALKENHEDGNQPSKNNPLLLSFPTESVYIVACCVNAVSSRSIRKIFSRVDSQPSLNSDDLDFIHQDSEAHHDNPPINDFIHPPNSSLEWLLECNGDSMPPTLFVLDGTHALNFFHFSKPKTFAIKPPSTPPRSNLTSVNSTPTRPEAPSSTSLPSSGATDPEKISKFAMTQSDPLIQAPHTPKRAIGSASQAAQAATPVTPNNLKLQAANFSESREAFLRLASKFWPGPVTIHVKVRTLGEEVPAVAHLSLKLAPSCSVASVPSLPSMGDLVSAESSDPGGSAAGVPVLPASILVPGEDNESYFVGMQCPSHPLPRKILNEVYRGTSSRKSSQRSFSNSSSSDSIASISSMDENVCGETKVTQSKNGPARSNVAVVGCMVPRPKSSVNSAKTSVTTAADVDKAMSKLVHSTFPNHQVGGKGRIFIVDGEDNRESFSVPTCEYGQPHPISLVVDGDNRTIHLMHHGPATEESVRGTTKGPLLNKKSIYRALLEPVSPCNGQTFIKEKKGDGTSIDRVITAVLSRWKIQENTIN